MHDSLRLTRKFQRNRWIICIFHLDKFKKKHTGFTVQRVEYKYLGPWVSHNKKKKNYYRGQEGIFLPGRSETSNEWARTWAFILAAFSSPTMYQIFQGKFDLVQAKWKKSGGKISPDKDLSLPPDEQSESKNGIFPHFLRINMCIHGKKKKWSILLPQHSSWDRARCKLWQQDKLSFSPPLPLSLSQACTPPFTQTLIPLKIPQNTGYA